MSAQRRGSLTLLTLSDGAAEVSWISDSTFRYTRCWRATCLSRSDGDASLDVKFREAPAELVWETKYIRLRLTRADLSLSVEDVEDSKRLFAQSPVTRAAPSGLQVRAELKEKERVYGLNAGKLNVRGLKVETAAPLALSSEGYGLYFGMPGLYWFDLTDGAAIRNIQAQWWEQYFYYGPLPKEILEEHRSVVGPIRSPSMADLRGKPNFARPVASLAEVAAASMSGILIPAIDGKLAWTSLAPPPAWDWYLYTYLCEARDRGLPVIRPLAMQFPADTEAALLTEEFMLGDEVLIALESRTYLPQGIWTDLGTGTMHRGRQWIDTPAGPRKFARNGTILPLMADGVMELHYFPRLGAEFFLSEPGGEQISQIHAGPAGEVLRLEIEPKADRKYEWVVHHVSNARAVTAIGMESPEPRYDAAWRELRIPVAARAGQGIIVKVSLMDPL